MRAERQGPSYIGRNFEEQIAEKVEGKTSIVRCSGNAEVLCRHENFLRIALVLRNKNGAAYLCEPV